METTTRYFVRRHRLNENGEYEDNHMMNNNLRQSGYINRWQGPRNTEVTHRYNTWGNGYRHWPLQGGQMDKKHQAGPQTLAAHSAKIIFGKAQCTRQQHNWTNIPRGVQRNIDRLLDNIMVPMPDGMIKTSKEDLKWKWGQEIRDIVNEHLIRKQTELDAKITDLTVQSADYPDAEIQKKGAEQIVNKYLHKHYGRKINNEQKQELVQAAFSRWTINHGTQLAETSQTPEAGANQNANTMAPIATTHTTVTTTPIVINTRQGDIIELQTQNALINTAVIHPRNKRTNSEMKLSNRFQALINPDEPSDDEDNELPTPQLNSSDRITPPAKKVKPTAGSSSRTEDTLPSPQLNSWATPLALTPVPANTTAVNENLIDLPTTLTPGSETTSQRNHLTSLIPSQGLSQVLAGSTSGPSTSTDPSYLKPRIIDTGNVAHQHERKSKGLKLQWTIQVKFNTRVLVISDSNFKRARRLPKDWQVEVYPGAALTHIDNLARLAQKQNSTRLEKVILSVGINDRDNDWSGTTQKSANQIVRTINSFPSTCPCYFLEVGIPEHLDLGRTGRAKDNLVRLNSHILGKLAATARFVPNIPSNTICTDDVQNIHYDQNTMDRIMDNLYMHFLGKTQQGKGGISPPRQ